jgi:acetolactate synthase-1/3 small subunit
MLKKTFTITISTENNTGMIVRIITMFSRRRIHIEAMNVVASASEGLHRFTIVINESEEVTRKLLQQIDKQVEVFKTFFQAGETVNNTQIVVR